MVHGGVPAARRLAGTVSGLELSLDETEFCKKCAPDAETPKLTLVVRYPGEKEPHRTRGVSVNDLKLIREFLAGKKKHTYSNDAEEPLKKHVDRIGELLGLGKGAGK
jgi:hypothetical protein